MGLLDKLESFGKAIWDTGKEAVDVVGDVGAVVEGIGAVGDFIERTGKAAHLDDVIDVGGRLAGWAERAGLNRFLRAANSPILDGGQLVIAGMRLTTGIDEPDDGERFGQGSARHHDATATLRSAQPTDCWMGDGASSYEGQNAKQAARTTTLAAADHEVHRVLATEAFQVNFHRGKLDDWSNWLADVGLVTYALGLIPEVGQALKAAADAQAVLAAVASSSLELYQLSSEADANAAAIQQLVGRYERVGQTSNLWSTSPDPGPPAPPPPGPSGPPPSQKPPSDGPGDDQPDVDPAEPTTEEAPREDDPSAPAPSAPGLGGGGGSPGGGDPAAAPPVLPERAPASSPATSHGSGAPASSGAPPVASGGMSPPPMSAGATPAAAAAGIPAGLIKEAVDAAMRRAAEEAKAKEDKDEEDDEEDKDNDGIPDDEEDKDGDGRPDKKSDVHGGPVTGPGGAHAGRAPVHIEVDVDPERLNTPMTVTLDF
jgi:hypothetical protein